MSFTVTYNGSPVDVDLYISGQKSKETKIEGGTLFVGNDEPIGTLLAVAGVYDNVPGYTAVKVVAEAAADTPTPNINKSSTNIKEKFGVTKTGTEGVKATFEILSAFIKAGGLTNEDTNDVIKLGDYIDLEGGLEVKAYNTLGAFEHAGTVQASNNTPLLRLIVVGINSFQSNRGVKTGTVDGTPTVNGDTGGQYTGIAANDGTQHVVFQFQNVPVIRRMNAGKQNPGGYPESEARKYLVPVTAVAGSGNFLDGLLKAGVTEDVLWDPARVLSLGPNGTGSETVRDKLWLPTEREMFGVKTYSPDSETAANQARLGYYKDPESRIKYTGQKAVAYWGVTGRAVPDPSSIGIFQGINALGNVDGYYGNKSENIGIAPAFCVQ
jgi:hypothetical protein